MKLNPHLSFDGQCEEAFQLYEKCLGGKISFMMTFEGSPMADQAPPGWGKKIMHATLKVGDTVVQGSDAPPKQYEKPQGMTVAIGLSDPAQAERIFKTLAEKGTVGMPLEETFWALRFGMLVDKFGTPWLINCEKAVPQS